MHLRNFLTFFKGYVRFRVEGKFLEKFLNLALYEGINFFNARTVRENVMELNVRAGEYRKLRWIAKRVSCRIAIVSKHGMPFIIKKLKKRKFLLFGVIFFLCALYLMSAFVWEVEVEAYEELRNVSEEEIITEARKLGLKPGILKTEIDTHELEKQLVQKVELLSWVGIDIIGTKIIIKVAERVIPSPEHLEKSPAHIVAKKDGIIEELLVMVGEPKVEVGDTVHKGQILISGIIEPNKNEEGEENENIGEIRKVRAKGIVRASVWYQSDGTADLVQVEKNRTGHSVERVKIVLGVEEYYISGPRDIDYQSFEVKKQVRDFKLGDLQIPVKLIKETYYEQNVIKKRLSEKEAVEKATKNAVEKIKRYLPTGTRIMEREVEVIDKSKQRVKVRVLVKTLEDIALLRPIQ